MNYSEYQERVRNNVNRGDLNQMVALWINETRDEVALVAPWTFTLLTRLEEPVIAQTESYVIDNGTDVDRYSGLLQSVVYKNTSGRTKLTKLTPEMFDRLYPAHLSNTDPTAYCLRGNKIVINGSLTTNTGTGLYISYHALPNILDNVTYTEEAIDETYYNAILAGATLKAAVYINASKLMEIWGTLYKLELEKLIAQEKGTGLTDVNLRPLIEQAKAVS